MVMKTIQCDLIVRRDYPRCKSHQATKNAPQCDDLAWCELCELAYEHTLLIIEINNRIQQHPSFLKQLQGIQNPSTSNPSSQQEQDWLRELVEEIVASLKENSQFCGLPGRLYTSAMNRIIKTFEGWLATQNKLINEIKGKRRWLRMLESDAALAENSSPSHLEVLNKAKGILDQITASRKTVVDPGGRMLINRLFKLYAATNNILRQRAIVHLIKNGGKVVEKPETPEEQLQHLEKVQVAIERCEKNLLAQLPKNRNLFPEQAFDESLEELITLVNPNQVRYEQYCFLTYLLFIQVSHPVRYLQFEQYLLNAIELECSRMSNLLYYDSLILCFLLNTLSEDQYFQLSRYLLHLIKDEVARVEAQFFDWYDSLPQKMSNFLREPKSLPYPISFGYDDARTWKEENKKILFKLNGLGDLIFEVRCDRRQLPLIKTFLKDWRTKNQKENCGQYSGSLMALRSVELIWKPKKHEGRNLDDNRKSSDTQLCTDREVFQQHQEKGFWNECKLSAHFTFETDALTQQGSEQIRERKLQTQLALLERKKAALSRKKSQLDQLEQALADANSQSLRKLTQKTVHLKKIKKLKQDIQTLQAKIDKPRPKLARLQQTRFFERPDRPPYQGIAHIFVSVVLDLDKHLIVAVVDVMRNKVLTYRNARQISKEEAKLLTKYLRQQQEYAKQRQRDQKNHRRPHLQESPLGQTIACLLAKGIVELAKQYKASTIVLPETNGWRERLYCQLVARARIHCKGIQKAMDRYTKQHGQKLHRWPYRRLSQAICNRAATEGVKVILQPSDFEQDCFAQAKNLAIAAYQALLKES